MHLRQYEIVQDVDKLKVDLQATFMKYKTIKQWAYIIHDKDDTRPHYHIYINFSTGVDSELVAKWFNLGWTDENGEEHSGENFINKVKGRKADMLMYLTHENETQKYKHIYDRSEVHSNFDFATEIEESKMLGDFVKYSYAQQIEYVHSLPIDERTTALSKLDKLWTLECRYRTLNPDRNIQVIFITGKGGTGKTTYAKKLLNSMNLDFCISSSSNDPFQDYMGQKAIILDDLRDKAFINPNGSDNFEDLLKILDNNTNSSVKSRFNNKVFNGDLIIITSAVPLCYWFPNHKGNNDDLQQLYRRISVYVEITEKLIHVYKELDSNGRPTGKETTFINECCNYKKQNNETIDIVSEFSKICQSIDLPEVKIYQQDELPF